MSNENEGALDKLKTIALGGKKPKDDTLELSADMIRPVEDEGGAETIDDIQLEDDHDSQPQEAARQDASPPALRSPLVEKAPRTQSPVAPTEERSPADGNEERSPADGNEESEAVALPTPVPAAPMVVDAEEHAGKRGLDPLMKGDLFPVLRMPMSEVDDYALMNTAVRDGRIRIDAVDGQPHVILTDQAIRSLVDDEKRAASEVIDRIEKSSERIAELEEEIRQINVKKTDDQTAAAIHSERIRQLQDSLEGN